MKDRPLAEALPAPNRPDAAPLASTTPSETREELAPVEAPRSSVPEPAPEPRSSAARTAQPTADGGFRPIPRRRSVARGPVRAGFELTERTAVPSTVPRRITEDGPRPVQSDATPAPGSGDLAMTTPAPELPPSPRGPTPSTAAPSGRTAFSDALPDSSNLPRRTRSPLLSEAADPWTMAELTERRTDLAPRPRRNDGLEDGPRAVVTESSGPLQAPGVPDVYRLRDLSRRAENARRLGGTVESEEAVEAALAWFNRAQEAEGYWDASKHGSGGGSDDDPDAEPDPDKRNTGREADAGLTGLVTLTFLGAGYTRTGGQYAPAVDGAVRWLIAQQKEDGSLAGDANYYARMYSHGIATYALAEALALEGDRADPALRQAVRNAVAYIVAEQYPDGGWRYSQRSPVGDMSMFGWQVMALKSADSAGVPMPADTRTRMIGFLRSRSETLDAEGQLVQYPYGGLARYKPEPGHKVKPAMTAEALFCKQMLGLKRDQPAAREAVVYLDRHPPDLRTWNLYHWYYASLALYGHGGPVWERWNAPLRDLLLKEQYQNGPQAGTWPVRPMSSNYTEYGGTLYATAMATLCLEVYYRFSPASGGAAAMDGRIEAPEDSP